MALGRQAILVCGPESSGTRLVTRILMAMGCQGDDGHEQAWDIAIPDVPLLVWRRSVPHSAQWWNLASMVEQLQDHHYTAQAVVTTRDWFSMIQSQVNTGHVHNQEQAYRHVQRAYIHIFGELQKAAIDYLVLSYESLVQRPELVQQRLAKHLGLVLESSIEIYDGNERYY